MAYNIHLQQKAKRYQVVLEYILVFLFFSLLSGVLFRNVLPLRPGFMLFGQDSHSYNFFMFDYLVKTLKKGVMPWWNPYIFSGVPMLSNPTGGSIYYPFNAIFLILPVSKAIFMFFFLHIAGAGLAMYWFCRKYLDRVSSLVSSLVLAFSGYMIGALYMGHIETVAVMTWLPIVIGALVRFMEHKKRKYFILFVLSLAVQILAGTYVAVLFTLEFILLYVLSVAVRSWVRKQKPAELPGTAGLVALGIALSFGMSAVELIPFWQNAAEGIRSAGLAFEVAARDSFNWNLFYLLITPIDAKNNIFLDISQKILLAKNTTFEFLLYIGVAALLMIVAGIILEINTWRKTKTVKPIWKFILAATVIFLLLSFGRNFVFYRFLYDIFPPYQMIRRPIRHFFIVTFCLAFLAGWGTGRIKKTFVKVLVLLIICSELLLYGGRYIRLIAEPTVQNSVGLVTYLMEHVQGSRIHFNFHNVGLSPKLLYENAGMYYRMPMVSGYSPMLLGRYSKFIGTAALDPRMVAIAQVVSVRIQSPVLNYLSARYILDQTVNEQARHDKQIPASFKPVYKDDTAVLYENPDAYPRFYLVGNIGVLNSDEEVLRLFKTANMDLASTVYLTEPEARKAESQIREYGARACRQNLSKGSLRLDHYAENGFRLTVDTVCPAILVTSEAYYPGWEARLDGNTTPLLRANYAFRSLLIPEGKHTIEVYYNPAIFLYSALASGLSCIALVIVLKRWKT